MVVSVKTFFVQVLMTVSLTIIFFICDPVQVHIKKPSLCLRCKVCILISRFRY